MKRTELLPIEQVAYYRARRLKDARMGIPYTRTGVRSRVLRLLRGSSLEIEQEKQIRRAAAQYAVNMFFGGKSFSIYEEEGHDARAFSVLDSGCEYAGYSIAFKENPPFCFSLQKFGKDERGKWRREAVVWEGDCERLAEDIAGKQAVIDSAAHRMERFLPPEARNETSQTLKTVKNGLPEGHELAARAAAFAEIMDVSARRETDADALIAELFPNGIVNAYLEQKDIGDCYFISALWMILQSPFAREFIARTVKKNPVGTWTVSFLTHRGERSFVITEDNLTPKSGEKTLANADLGIKIIERAFCRMMREERECYYASIQGATMTVGDDRRRLAVEGGCPEYTFEVLLGPFARSDHIMPSMAPSFQLSGGQAVMEQTLHIIGADNGSKTLAVVTTGQFTPGERQRNDKYLDKDEGIRFAKNHAYALLSVDPASRTAVIVNPHDSTKQRYTVSFDCLSRNFNCISFAHFYPPCIQTLIRLYDSSLNDDMKTVVLKTRCESDIYGFFGAREQNQAGLQSAVDLFMSRINMRGNYSNELLKLFWDAVRGFLAMKGVTRVKTYGNLTLPI